MTTLNLTANNDIIIPTNDDTTYRGLGGDDTYIFLNNESGSDTILTWTKNEDKIDINSYLSTVGLSNNASDAIDNDYLIIQQNALDVAIYFDELGNGNLTDQICLVENTLISQIDATSFV